MVSVARSDSLLDLPPGSDEEEAMMGALRVTAGFLLSALFVIFLVLSVHAFEADQEASPDMAKVWGVNESFPSSDL